MTQAEKVLDYMKSYGSISTWQAFEELGITRLASRINDIEKSGVPIRRETVYKENRYGDRIHFTKYSIRG